MEQTPGGRKYRSATKRLTILGATPSVGDDCNLDSQPMIDAYIQAWQSSFDYSGRSKRSDFWWYQLANLIVLVFIAIITAKITALQALYVVYCIAQIFPSLSLTIRRLRDGGKAWPWIFINLVPLVGPIWLLVLLCQPSLPVA